MLSIVVPFRGDGGRRDELWSWCRRRWESITDAEIVLGPSTGEVFSRSEACNNGARAASGDVLLFADADHVPTREWFDDALAHAGTTWSVPGTHVFLGKAVSDEWLSYQPDTRLTDLPKVLPPDVEWWGETGVSGLVMVHRNHYERVGGFDERFDGWGLQDAAFALALGTLVGQRRSVSWCAHLWHPHNKAEPTGVGQEYGNWDLIRRYQDAVDDKTAMRSVIG